MRAKQFTTEASLGTNPKRPARAGSRPDRGHTPTPRYKNVDEVLSLEAELTALDEHKKNRVAKKYTKKPVDPSAQHAKAKEKLATVKPMEGTLDEHGKASRELCNSSKPDADLGASMLASCKSQGLRARDGNKSHKLGKSAKSRVKVGGHRIKGRKYGGPLPDWS
jgi:hypothetical protein